MDQQELQSRLKRVVRMVFQDLLVNLHSNEGLWRGKKVRVAQWDIALAESNAGTLQLTCAGIETFGRLAFGLGSSEQVSKKSFVGFIDLYFPTRYKGRGGDIYETFRCGLLHSHYLGFASDKGFFPTRGRKQFWDKHLEYTDATATLITALKTPATTRLILNIEVFAADFQAAVEKYVADAFAGATRTLPDGTSSDLRKNTIASLSTMPVDYDFHVRGLQLNDATVSGTTTSS